MLKISIENLKQKQALPLDIKVLLTQNRIRDWHYHWFGKTYISFSGGKDSTVLLHLVRNLFPETPAVFCDTGLEYPEIKEFVKTKDDITIIRPKMNYKKVIEKYGYPVISKEQARYIRLYRTTKSQKMKNKCWMGSKNGYFKISEKWKFLVDAPFKISEECCDVMKKRPFKIYEKETGRKGYLGIMAGDSHLRKLNYMKTGCNAFENNRPLSQPMSFWLEKDIWEYIKQNNLSYAPIYDKGITRTGCIFCMFSLFKNKFDKFAKLQELHPKLYRHCMEDLGIRKVLDYINSHIDKNYYQEALDFE